MKPEDIAAADLAGMLKAGAALPIDVRENDEFSEGHIAGAVSRPLSRFDPRALPDLPLAPLTRDHIMPLVRLP